MKRSLMSRKILVLIGLCLCLGLLAPQVQAKNQLVYFGTWGTWEHGPVPQSQRAMLSPDKAPAQGIYAAEFDPKTGHLSPLGIQAVLESAAWLKLHPTLPVLYAVASGIGGRPQEYDIYSYTIDNSCGKLWLINNMKSGGGDSTHLNIDADSKTLFVANHNTGNVTALPLGPDGRVEKVVAGMDDYGSGPHVRQSHAKPHAVVVDPTHRYLLCADLGSDRIFVYHFDGATRSLSRANPPFTQLPPGSGPRHMAFHPNGKFLYLLTEFKAEINAYNFDPENGNLNQFQLVQTYPENWDKVKSGAEIIATHDGKFVYVSLRAGQDCVIVYEVNQQNGKLTEIQRISSKGEWPWCMDIDPTGKWMLVGNMNSNSVTVFKRDPATGKLQATDESLQVPKPVTLVFYAN